MCHKLLNIGKGVDYNIYVVEAVDYRLDIGEGKDKTKSEENFGLKLTTLHHQ